MHQPPADAGSATAVAVSDLRMRYGTKDVLHGVSFAVERGEVVTLLGPNGAGKTTIIEILEGFRSPSAGAVEVLGSDPAQADEDWRARVGIVLQSWRDHGKWRVRQLLHNLGVTKRLRLLIAAGWVDRLPRVLAPPGRHWGASPAPVGLLGL